MGVLGWGAVRILNEMAKTDLVDKVVFAQRPAEGEGLSHDGI